MRTDRLRADYQIEFRYTLFPLHPDTPDEGLSLEQLFAGRSFDIDAMQARLASLMAEEGLPFSQRTMTYNSRLAQELAKWAETQTGGAGIHDALYRAYFVDGLNIALIENLMTVVRQLGLPEDEAREVLASRRFRDAVDADWRRCRKLGSLPCPRLLSEITAWSGHSPTRCWKGWWWRAGLRSGDRTRRQPISCASRHLAVDAGCLIARCTLTPFGQESVDGRRSAVAVIQAYESPCVTSCT